MRNLTSIAVAFILAGLAGRACAEDAAADKPIKILSGQPRLVVVNGYSTSFRWPKILQGKLDRFFDGKRVVEVVSATRGGTPVAKWIDVKTGKPLRAWSSVTNALKRKGDRPAIMLAQQSLQWAFGARTAGIGGPKDAEHIKQGADILEKYVRLFFRDGADLVFVAMHIYKHPMEPEIGNERLALAALAKRKIPNFRAGPDVWTPTKAVYPRGFARDRVHPGDAANEIMAQLWFETLVKHDGLDVPAWSRKKMQQAVEAAQPKETARARARARKALVLVDQMAMAVDLFFASMNKYPDDELGLRALVEVPDDEEEAQIWRDKGGPFLKDGKPPKDPWGTDLKYMRLVSDDPSAPQYRVYSYGPNKTDDNGSEDDIPKWAEESNE